MAAAVASGTYSDLREAAQQMVHVGKTFEPNSHHHAIYNDKFALYESVSGALSDQWKRF